MCSRVSHPVPPSAFVQAPKSGVENSSDPYELYELRSPYDRASSVVPTHLVKQPGFASTRASFQRVLVDDVPVLASGEKSSDLPAGNYPRPFCMPSRMSLLDPLTDDESMLSLTSERALLRRRHIPSGDWEDPLDVDAIRDSWISNNTPEKELRPLKDMALLPPKVRNSKDEGFGIHRNESRFGYKALRHIHSRKASEEGLRRTRSSVKHCSSADSTSSIDSRNLFTFDYGDPEGRAFSSESSRKKGGTKRTPDGSSLLQRLHSSTAALRRCRTCHETAYISSQNAPVGSNADVALAHAPRDPMPGIENALFGRRLKLFFSRNRRSEA